MGTDLHSAARQLSHSDPRTKLLDAKIRKEGARPASLIEILHTAQDAYGFLPVPVLAHISRALHLPPSRVYATASFYHFFSLQSRGRHSCLVCMGTACYVKGARALLASIEAKTGLRAGKVSDDGALGLQVARCVGACGLAPVVMLDDEVLPHATVSSVLTGIDKNLKQTVPDASMEAEKPSTA